MNPSSVYRMSSSITDNLRSHADTRLTSYLGDVLACGRAAAGAIKDLCRLRHDGRPVHGIRLRKIADVTHTESGPTRAGRSQSRKAGDRAERRDAQ